MGSNALVAKLLQAEQHLVELGKAGRSKTSNLTADARDRMIHDALNQLRGALQLAREDAPVVERRPYSSTLGEGLGKDRSVVERHESFGVISVSKPSGGAMRLVGAMADSLPTCVEIRVHPARRDIDTHLHTEHYYHDGGRPIVVVRLSTYQWAELICNMMGAQIPCTIDCVQGVRMDPVPADVKTPLEQIAHDTRAEVFKTQTEVEKRFTDEIDGLLARVGDLGLSKKKETDLRAAVEQLRKHITAPKATAAWAAQRLTEDTEKTVGQARMEMAAALQSLVQRTGLQAIAGRLTEAIGLQLPDGERK